MRPRIQAKKGGEMEGGRGEIMETKEQRTAAVVVGIKMDAAGHQLLTWALVKIAAAGDRVVALHVLPSPAAAAAEALDASSRFLSVYDGLCSLKQIDLELKIARCSSVPKVLVREFISHGATKLVLGVAKSSHVIGCSSKSVAKYCAKKLPRDCSVFAVQNGKALFKREASPAQTLTVDKEEEETKKIKPSLLSLEDFSSQDKPGWPLLRSALLSQSAPRSIEHPQHKPTANSRVESRVPEELVHLQEKYGTVCRVFSYEDVICITSEFSPKNLVGKGGSSHVYKGSFSDGQEWALKVLKSSDHHAMEEFASEIEIVTAMKHKNIVSLVGFCSENNKLTLVYNFLSRGSLEDNLHGLDSNKNAIGWAERYKVAVGVAAALDYLHSNGDAPSVIHRDVKSSNILLSDDFEPQLSDFGLAMWASASAAPMICNDVAGTFGYLAPEYFMHGKVNEKIDIYAFGVVLLELISGRKSVDTGAKGQESLVMWAMPILQGGKLEELVDPCLRTGFVKSQLERMALVAFLCIRRSPHSRPRMELVLKLLKGDDDVVRWARQVAHAPEKVDDLDDEAILQHKNLQAHIDLALQDIDDVSSSINSIEPLMNMSMEEYLEGRWSRSSSLN
ncbi:serine/threonine-protein kinase CDG1-like isoform X1 [Zingiber officinale]|uniref:serine/threonine-protein kinase CDG1-like isoform X1 n=1 Tax=Zingiber officinale TaxID=94328 RepID=UPI001C4D53D5|nr:serine/threonine-protein kinase CDG1-like isoform X1 [Zingiber officinale]